MNDVRMWQCDSEARSAWIECQSRKKMGYTQGQVLIVSLPDVGCAVSTVAIVVLADNVLFVVGRNGDEMALV